MFTLKAGLVGALSLLVIGGCTTLPPAPFRYGLGSTPTAADIRAWDIDVTPDGKGLPPGSGSVTQGHALYAQHCSACHGATGEGGPGGRLVGGRGSLGTARPVLSIGSFWPYATTLYDYIYRAMPHTRPQSLRPDEVYALTAFLLHQNGIVGPDTALDAQSLPKVVMPNRRGFTSPDPRPDVQGNRCMKDCKPDGAS
jgi:S-disulfanyl-L-cysteine oxidoreductase SoxD